MEATDYTFISDRDSFYPVASFFPTISLKFQYSRIFTDSQTENQGAIGQTASGTPI